MFVAHECQPFLRQLWGQVLPRALIYLFHKESYQDSKYNKNHMYNNSMLWVPTDFKTHNMLPPQLRCSRSFSVCPLLNQVLSFMSWFYHIHALYMCLAGSMFVVHVSPCMGRIDCYLSELVSEWTLFIVAVTIFQSHSDWNKVYQAQWLLIYEQFRVSRCWCVCTGPVLC